MATIFEKIIERKLPADIFYEDEKMVIIKDIKPEAPLHYLVISKMPIPSLREAQEGDSLLLGEMLLKAAAFAKKENLGDYRLVINDGEDAGQTVFHLHIHILAGRKLGLLG